MKFLHIDEYPKAEVTVCMLEIPEIKQIYIYRYCCKIVLQRIFFLFKSETTVCSLLVGLL